ncbi:hypothetical protein KP509_07G081100 [Ceratopteris richardii]|uniref:Uncharacterized protein n=2 Tax=Ceratopteris richardii TaxID=49495 RepID=A0A8T2UDZ8_CERRI|nr:hypothetical protein KP509_07G081100 [Ceratopteris richardii]
MDYHKLPRRQLQSLCKKQGIPANGTNVEMADALSALLKPHVETASKKREEDRTNVKTKNMSAGCEDANSKLASNQRRVTRNRESASDISTFVNPLDLNVSLKTYGVSKQGTRSLTTRSAGNHDEEEMNSREMEAMRSQEPNLGPQRKISKTSRLHLRLGRVKVRSPKVLSPSSESRGKLENFASLPENPRTLHPVITTHSCLVDKQRALGRKDKRSVTFSDVLQVSHHPQLFSPEANAADNALPSDAWEIEELGESCDEKKDGDCRNSSTRRSLRRAQAQEMTKLQLDPKSSRKGLIKSVSQSEGFHGHQKTLRDITNKNAHFAPPSNVGFKTRSSKIGCRNSNSDEKTRNDATILSENQQNTADIRANENLPEEFPCPSSVRRSRRLSLAAPNIAASHDKEKPTEDLEAHDLPKTIETNKSDIISVSSTRRNKRSAVASSHLNTNEEGSLFATDKGFDQSREKFLEVVEESEIPCPSNIRRSRRLTLLSTDIKFDQNKEKATEVLEEHGLPMISEKNESDITSVSHNRRSKRSTVASSHLSIKEEGSLIATDKEFDQGKEKSSEVVEEKGLRKSSKKTKSDISSASSTRRSKRSKLSSSLSKINEERNEIEVDQQIKLPDLENHSVISDVQNDAADHMDGSRRCRRRTLTLPESNKIHLAKEIPGAEKLEKRSRRVTNVAVGEEAETSVVKPARVSPRSNRRSKRSTGSLVQPETCWNMRKREKGVDKRKKDKYLSNSGVQKISKNSQRSLKLRKEPSLVLEEGDGGSACSVEVSSVKAASNDMHGCQGIITDGPSTNEKSHFAYQVVQKEGEMRHSSPIERTSPGKSIEEYIQCAETMRSPRTVNLRIEAISPKRRIQNSNFNQENLRIRSPCACSLDALEVIAISKSEIKRLSPSVTGGLHDELFNQHSSGTDVSMNAIIVANEEISPFRKHSVDEKPDPQPVSAYIASPVSEGCVMTGMLSTVNIVLSSPTEKTSPGKSTEESIHCTESMRSSQTVNLLIEATSPNCRIQNNNFDQENLRIRSPCTCSLDALEVIAISKSEIKSLSSSVTGGLHDELFNQDSSGTDVNMNAITVANDEISPFRKHSVDEKPDPQPASADIASPVSEGCVMTGMPSTVDIVLSSPTEKISSGKSTEESIQCTESMRSSQTMNLRIEATSPDCRIQNNNFDQENLRSKSPGACNLNPIDGVIDGFISDVQCDALEVIASSKTDTGSLSPSLADLHEEIFNQHPSSTDANTNASIIADDEISLVMKHRVDEKPDPEPASISEECVMAGMSSTVAIVHNADSEHKNLKDMYTDVIFKNEQKRARAIFKSARKGNRPFIQESVCATQSDLEPLSKDDCIISLDLNDCTKAQQCSSIVMEIKEFSSSEGIDEENSQGFSDDESVIDADTLPLTSEYDSESFCSDIDSCSESGESSVYDSEVEASEVDDVLSDEEFCEIDDLDTEAEPSELDEDEDVTSSFDDDEEFCEIDDLDTKAEFSELEEDEDGSSSFDEHEASSTQLFETFGTNNPLNSRVMEHSAIDYNVSQDIEMNNVEFSDATNNMVSLSLERLGAFLQSEHLADIMQDISNFSNEAAVEVPFSVHSGCQTHMMSKVPSSSLCITQLEVDKENVYADEQHKKQNFVTAMELQSMNSDGSSESVISLQPKQEMQDHWNSENDIVLSPLSSLFISPSSKVKDLNAADDQVNNECASALGELQRSNTSQFDEMCKFDDQHGSKGVSTAEESQNTDPGLHDQESLDTLQTEQERNTVDLGQAQFGCQSGTVVSSLAFLPVSPPEMAETMNVDAERKGASVSTADEFHHGSGVIQNDIVLSTQSSLLVSSTPELKASTDINQVGGASLSMREGLRNAALCNDSLLAYSEQIEQEISGRQDQVQLDYQDDTVLIPLSSLFATPSKDKDMLNADAEQDTASVSTADQFHHGSGGIQNDIVLSTQSSLLVSSTPEFKASIDANLVGGASLPIREGLQSSALCNDSLLEYSEQIEQEISSTQDQVQLDYQDDILLSPLSSLFATPSKEKDMLNVVDEQNKASIPVADEFYHGSGVIQNNIELSTQSSLLVSSTPEFKAATNDNLDGGATLPIREVFQNAALCNDSLLACSEQIEQEIISGSQDQVQSDYQDDIVLSPLSSLFAIPSKGKEMLNADDEQNRSYVPTTDECHHGSAVIENDVVLGTQYSLLVSSTPEFEATTSDDQDGGESLPFRKRLQNAALCNDSPLARSDQIEQEIGGIQDQVQLDYQDDLLAPPSKGKEMFNADEISKTVLTVQVLGGGTNSQYEESMESMATLQAEQERNGSQTKACSDCQRDIVLKSQTSTPITPLNVREFVKAAGEWNDENVPTAGNHKSLESNPSCLVEQDINSAQTNLSCQQDMVPSPLSSLSSLFATPVSKVEPIHVAHQFIDEAPSTVGKPDRGDGTYSHKQSCESMLSVHEKQDLNGVRVQEVHVDNQNDVILTIIHEESIKGVNGFVESCESMSIIQGEQESNDNVDAAVENHQSITEGEKLHTKLLIVNSIDTDSQELLPVTKTLEALNGGEILSKTDEAIIAAEFQTISEKEHGHDEAEVQGEWNLLKEDQALILVESHVVLENEYVDTNTQGSKSEEALKSGEILSKTAYAIIAAEFQTFSEKEHGHDKAKIQEGEWNLLKEDQALILVESHVILENECVNTNTEGSKSEEIKIENYSPDMFEGICPEDMNTFAAVKRSGQGEPAMNKQTTEIETSGIDKSEQTGGKLNSGSHGSDEYLITDDRFQDAAAVTSTMEDVCTEDVCTAALPPSTADSVVSNDDRQVLYLPIESFSPQCSAETEITETIFIDGGHEHQLEPAGSLEIPRTPTAKASHGGMSTQVDHLFESLIHKPHVQGTEDPTKVLEGSLAYQIPTIELSKEQAMQQFDDALCSIRKLKKMCKENESTMSKIPIETPSRKPFNATPKPINPAHPRETSLMKTPSRMSATKQKLSLQSKDLSSASKRSALKPLHTNINYSTPSAQTPVKGMHGLPRNLMSPYRSSEENEKNIAAPSPQPPTSSRRNNARIIH